MYERQKKVRRIIKVKHSKGYGTDKEHHIKKTGWEVRCDIHGSVQRGRDSRLKTLRVTAPMSRFERNVMGCPICYHLRMGEENEMRRLPK